MAELKIFVVVLGDPQPSNNMFPVTAAASKSVGEWREEVHSKLGVSDAVVARNLILWKLESAIPSNQVDKEVAALAASQNLSEVAVKMLPTDELSDHFPTPPALKSLHVIVELPSSTLKRKRGNEDAPAPLKKRRVGLLPQSLTVFKTEANPEKPNDPVLLPTQGGGFVDMTSLYNLIAVDKTKYIELLDKEPKYQYMFLRPRRWGKSTFLQTLIAYYNKATKDSFGDIFGGLYIGKNPTSARNSLLTLRFDFSTISGTSTYEVMKKQFDAMINNEVQRFLEENATFLGGVTSGIVDPGNGTNSLRKVLYLVEKRGERLFVGVDEYDAPANTVIFDEQGDRYQGVAEFFKTSFFAIMKQATATVVDKYWITGVLPVFRDGISPLNATQIISNKPGYNGLCGLTDTEVQQIAQLYLSSSDHERRHEDVVKELKRWYNGYLFCPRKNESNVDTLYNPQLVFNHLRGVAHKAVRLAPLEEIYSADTSSVLEAIPDTGDGSYFGSYLSMISNTVTTTLVYQFGVPDIRRRGKDAKITWTLLYFFGILTYAEDGLHLKVPNVTMTNVITRRFSNFLNKEPQLESESNAAYKGVLEGQVKPVVELLEGFFRKQPARAVKECNESTLRTALAAFWSTQPVGCILELSLLANPNAPQGKDRSNFLDIFLPGSASAPCIELKNIRLDALWRGESKVVLNSDTPLEGLRERLLKETEDQLLARKFNYGKEQKSVKDVKEEAFKQIRRYLDVMKNGEASRTVPGVNDRRLQHSENECELIGYVVILLGGTRALGWCVTKEQTKAGWHIITEEGVPVL